LVKRIVFGCSGEFLPLDNDGYITPMTTEGTMPVPLNAPVLNVMMIVFLFLALEKQT